MGQSRQIPNPFLVPPLSIPLPEHPSAIPGAESSCRQRDAHPEAFLISQRGATCGESPSQLCPGRGRFPYFASFPEKPDQSVGFAVILKAEQHFGFSTAPKGDSFCREWPNTGRIMAANGCLVAEGYFCGGSPWSTQLVQGVECPQPGFQPWSLRPALCTAFTSEFHFKDIGRSAKNPKQQGREENCLRRLCSSEQIIWIYCSGILNRDI